MTDCLSATVSLEDVYKALLVGDGRRVLSANTRYVFKYRNGCRLAEILEKEFEPDPRFLSFAEAKDFEENARGALGSTGGRRYLATYFGPNREAGEPIPLIYLAVQVADAKELVAPGKLDQILTAARNAPSELGIDPDSHVP